jgi:hypothetical protein
MRFSSVKRDRAGEKSLEVLLPGVDKAVPVIVRALSAMEEGASKSGAITRATKLGSKSPAPGDPLYDAAWWANVVAVAYLDVESPPEARATFFKDSDEVLRGLPTDALAYLFQEQQVWQEVVSPTYKTQTGAQLVEAIRKVAGEDGEGFFARCSPATQIALARFMAALLETVRNTSSPSGSPSTASTGTSSTNGQRRSSRSRRKPSAPPSK